MVEGDYMKKYTLIIFILILFLFGVKEVCATEAIFSGAESLTGVSYVKYDGYYYHFRNAKAIRNVNTGNIAYCIEPFATLVDGSSYTGYIEYNNIFKLSKEQWERLKLLAYYGYGYRGHTDKKWITITQILIWRTVDPKHSFNWIDNVNDRNVIYPYENEIQELESLIANHKVLPNISSKITMSINSTLELVDENHVINNFRIKYSEIDAEIIDNKLVINSSDVGSKKIVLVKEFGGADSSVEFFYRNDSQSVIERGNVDSVEIEFEVNVESGSIKIIKVDSSTKDVYPSGEASLVGAKYSVCDLDDHVVGAITIASNSEGVLENIPYGFYKIKEITPGVGYYLDSKEYLVEINHSNLNIVKILENKVIDSKIKIVKYYGSKEDYDNSTMRLESGIKFEFYNRFGDLVHTAITDELGEIEVVLPYGQYTLKQVNSTENYNKVHDIDFVVDETSNVSIYLPLYDLEIDVPDAYIEEGNSLYDVILLLILTLLLGVVYIV